MREHEKWFEEELARLHFEMQRMMRKLIPPEQWQEIQSHRGFRPPTDVYETDNYAVVRVEVAGVEENDWNVTFLNHVLSVMGYRRDPADKLAYQQMEIRYGEFRSDVFIPWSVKEEEIQASYEKGFLVVLLPKKPEAEKVPMTVIEQEG
ncbi:MAG: Hsp20/alpha crystallin family protein [Chloroflexi bacterium]|nr:Hsp20/alpha crystallin family protein [Chloroflexota bacterium]